MVRELDWAERLHYLRSAWHRDVDAAPGPASTYSLLNTGTADSSVRSCDPAPGPERHGVPCRQHQRLHSLVRYCRESAIEILGRNTSTD